MTESHGTFRSAGASSSLPAILNFPGFNTTLVGLLIQTALISVVEGTYETFSASRGFNLGSCPASSGKSRFSLKFYQSALISKALGRKSKLYSTGRVAGQRHRRRAVSG
jgi:hypothetical protein